MKIVIQIYEHGDAIMAELHPTELPHLMSILRDAVPVFKAGAHWHHSDRARTTTVTLVQDSDVCDRATDYKL